MDGSGRQVYQLTQGATVVTVTVDRTANTTTVVDGSGTRNYTGQPRGIVYASGNINDLGGPNRSGGTVPPALADNTNLLVVSNSDVVIQHDITYHDYYDGESVLGVFSERRQGPHRHLGPERSPAQRVRHGRRRAGAFQVDNYDLGSARGTVHLTGGIVAQYYGAFGQFNSSGGIAHGYARDFHFDDRGLMPPYYPTTTNFTANLPSARTLTWKEQ